MRIALKHNGKYLAAEASPLGQVNWNRDQLGPWETWDVIVASGGGIALKSAHGYYLAAEGGGGGVVVADRPELGPWETWAPRDPFISGQTALRSWDGTHYLTAIGEQVSAMGTTPQVFQVVVVEANTPPNEIPRLTLSGHDFMVNGQRIALRGATAFMLYRNWLEGRDTTSFMEMLQDLGCNMVRIFGMAHYTPINAGGRAFKPQDFGDAYYNDISAFYNMLASYSMYGMWTNFPDNDFIMPALNDQQQHHARVIAELNTIPNALYELTNEIDAHTFNRVDPTKFFRPSNVLSCTSGHGDQYGGDVPPWPQWDFASFHPPRRYPNHIVDCVVVNNPSYRKLGLGVLLGEPDRFGTDGNPDATKARQSAGASRETALGIVFHSSQGRSRSEGTFDDVTMRCATAFFKALS